VIVNLGRYGYGAVNDLSTNGDLGFLGDVSWLAGNGGVRIYSERMLNQRASRSGSLRIRLWATETPYAGEPILQGYVMATRGVGRISVGGSVPSFSRSAIFHAPPVGEYFVTMTLEESSSSQWNIVDYVTFQQKSIF
jgi:hypothetical protein